MTKEKKAETFIVFLVILFFGIPLLYFLKLFSDLENENECYKIYLSDNVILKECKKYFE